MAFQVTTAVKKILALDGTTKVIQGSTSSGKTYGIVPIVYDKVLEFRDKGMKCRATITAQTFPSLEGGCIQIFKDFMMEQGRWVESKWNETKHRYQVSPKCFLEFKVYDSEGKARTDGKRQLLFMNEANHINYDIADALMIRTDYDIWLDFNADMEFWAHTEILTQPDASFLKLTYLDNEGIPEKVLDKLMQRKAKAEAEERSGVLGYWWNWWQVFGLGEVGRLQEAVYPRWEVVDEKPERFTRFIYGLDFGFQHPSALIRVWFWEDELFVEEVVYESGLTSSQLIQRMKSKGVETSIEIMCDYARPEMINDLADAGFYVLNADKSVEKGINFINEMRVLVHKDSVNIQRENRLYKRKTINGQITEHIDKKNDDAMDAIRYAGAEIKEIHYSGATYSSF